MYEQKNKSNKKDLINWNFFSNTKLDYTQPKKLFNTKLIFHHFDLESHMKNKINEFGHTINKTFSMLILNFLSYQYLMAFLICKITSIKIMYKTYNYKL